MKWMRMSLDLKSVVACSNPLCRNFYSRCHGLAVSMALVLRPEKITLNVTQSCT